ncbi:MAG TPA: UDP-N-acetylmuramate--L-alanine ligase [Candidatus Bathyarchaeia archaeon]|nr:UDP-N-acetylmuramate--L-alanine ligase [Candidatus Bathyarchaeia archaeon]
MELKKIKHLHFVGIKGVGMTALALCAQDLGIKVTGSDLKEVFVTDEILEKRKIEWKVGFKKENLVGKPDLVIVTGAHQGLANPEAKASRKLGIKTITQGEAVGEFMKGKVGISTCGVGGKTTTAAMIATVLDKAGLKPSFAIGAGEIASLGVSGRYDKGNHFVAEADEYVASPGIDNRPKFIFQKPRVIVATNIEYDHPDVYPDLKAVLVAYKGFFEKIPDDGLLVACIDNQNIRRLLTEIKAPVQTYGFSREADWQIEKIYFSQEQTLFNLVHQGMAVEEIKLQVPGKYNVLNATAAFAVGTFLGIGAQKIKEGLKLFQGTRRRFELIGEVGGVRVYDDYAHHPIEIKSMLAAAKGWFPGKRIIAIFQPHTFSRTKAFFDQFARAFSQAEVVIFTDIYSSAREKPLKGINSRLLAQEAQKYHPRPIYLAGKGEVAEYLSENTKIGDIIITVGAGDIFLWHKEILKSLKS